MLERNGLRASLDGLETSGLSGEEIVKARPVGSNRVNHAKPMMVVMVMVVVMISMMIGANTQNLPCADTTLCVTYINLFNPQNRFTDR